MRHRAARPRLIVGGPEWQAAPKAPTPTRHEDVTLPPLAICETCGVPFPQATPEQKNCSKQHARAAAKRRSKARRKGLLPPVPPTPPAKPTPPPTIPKVHERMLAAARTAGNNIGIGDPYGASIRDYLCADGSIDREGLAAADAEAERENIRAWTIVLEAALTAVAREARDG